MFYVLPKSRKKAGNLFLSKKHPKSTIRLIFIWEKGVGGSRTAETNINVCVSASDILVWRIKVDCFWFLVLYPQPCFVWLEQFVISVNIQTLVRNCQSFLDLTPKIVVSDFFGHLYKHHKNCESCQSQVTWKVKFKCPVPSRPVPSRPVPSCPVHHDHVDHEEVGSYTRKLEVVHKEVGGCTQGSWRLYIRKLEVIWSDPSALIIMNWFPMSTEQLYTYRYRAALAATKSTSDSMNELLKFCHSEW